MKKILLTISAMLAVITALAQKPDEGANGCFFDTKIREFVYRLELTREQEDQFVVLYKQYSEDMHAAVGDKKKDGFKVKDATVEEVAARVKARIERQQKAQNVRLAYVDKFAKILNGKQLNKLYKVEKEIQDKLKERKGHLKGDGHRPHPKD